MKLTLERVIAERPEKILIAFESLVLIHSRGPLAFLSVVFL